MKERNISWNDLLRLESTWLSFIIWAVYDLQLSMTMKSQIYVRHERVMGPYSTCSACPKVLRAIHVGTVVEEAVKRAKKNQKRVMPRCIAFRPAAVVPTLVQWTRTSGTIVS